MARTIPGEETDRLGEKAKQHNLYIAGDMYTKEEEWPNHHFHTSFLIGPNGKVIHNRWKAYIAPSVIEWATTVHDVMDEFIKRYDWNSVWPVARTDIGNIATMKGIEGLLPETWRAFAFRGAEIYTHMISSSWTADPFKYMAQAMSAVNNCFTIFCQPAKVLNAKIHFESCYSFSTFIVDNKGRIMREARYDSEGCIYDEIPIAQFRKGRSIPTLRTSIYRDIYTNPKYEKNPPNLYLEYIPKDGIDAARYAKEKAKW
jgi:predicted amidohydrolase